jgi:hypothetical protein
MATGANVEKRPGLTKLITERERSTRSTFVLRRIEVDDQDGNLDLSPCRLFTIFSRS